MRLARVDDPANSSCDSAKLASLDFKNWWTDTSFDKLYLHVQHVSDGTVHRVYCRHAQQPRLQMFDGMLHWLIDEANKGA